MCLLLVFLMEMAIAIVGFVFPHNMNTFLEDSLTEKIIHTYRDDPDLQNFIDFAQQEFKCCGLSNAGYMDWGKNEYFNCSSPRCVANGSHLLLPQFVQPNNSTFFCNSTVLNAVEYHLVAVSMRQTFHRAW